MTTQETKVTIFYVCFPCGESKEEAERMKDIFYRKWGLVDAVIRTQEQIAPSDQEQRRGDHEYKEIHPR